METDGAGGPEAVGQATERELRTMMGWYGDGTWGGWAGWSGWVVMLLVMVAFWTLVVVAVVAMFRGTRDGATRVERERPRPLDVLDERFARGEIDADEYHARQAVLRAGVH